jgi:hypothetical protein
LAIAKKTKEEVKKKFSKDLNDLSKQELKEIILINTYKLALVRSQLEVVSDILIKKKLATYEEIWAKTNENFRESNI